MKKIHRRDAEGAEKAEKPILFSSEMVRALLAGRKTMTRRIIEPAVPDGHAFDASSGLFMTQGSRLGLVRHPRYNVGNVLWVREAIGYSTDRHGKVVIVYRADNLCRFALASDEGEGDLCGVGERTFAFMVPPTWKPSIHMPRWACRIRLRVTSVNAERVQDISEEDSLRCGIRSFTKDGVLKKYWWCDPFDGPGRCTWQNLPRTAVEAVKALWISIHGAESFAANPWVWCYGFERCSPEAKL